MSSDSPGSQAPNEAAPRAPSHAYRYGGHDLDDDHAEATPWWRWVSPRAVIIAALVTIAIVAAARSIFFVDETEYVYVTQFGQPLRLVVEPGLGWKLPFQSVWRFDRRLQIFSPPGREMLTEDKENLNIEWYVCWRLPCREFVDRELESSPTEGETADARIERHVRQFLQSVGDVPAAERRLEERIQSAVAAEVGRIKLANIVSLDPSQLALDDLIEKVTADIRASAAEQFGIEVVDVRVKRFNYPESVKPAVFAEIRSERARVADQYRAEGRSQATKIRSLAELHRDQILSLARRDAIRVRGEGEAKAIEIANAAHSQDVAFYELLKTLDTYRAMLDDQTTVVLSADSPLLRLLTQGLQDPPPTSGASAAQAATTPSAAVTEPIAAPTVVDGSER